MFSETLVKRFHHCANISERTWMCTSMGESVAGITGAVMTGSAAALSTSASPQAYDKVLCYDITWIRCHKAIGIFRLHYNLIGPLVCHWSKHHYVLYDCNCDMFDMLILVGGNKMYNVVVGSQVKELNTYLSLYI